MRRRLLPRTGRSGAGADRPSLRAYGSEDGGLTGQVTARSRPERACQGPGRSFRYRPGPSPAERLIPAEGADIIAHQDLAPWNLVAGGEDAWAFIDWDTAAPGSRLWDVAYAVHGFIPLSADPDWQRTDAADRLRVFAEAYGLDEAERRQLVPLLGRRTRSMHDFLRDRAAQGDQPWATLWAEGHGDIWRSDAEYIEQREELWARALLAG
ncbi:phosphotransferase [Streptomyces sp. NPDC021096]|uniref:phosphotransferase n=1 Tax=Streptomyces sp. NPDC021096 TaxID=3154792 RepID=UPI0033E01405